jgi:hypothetical protein
MVPNIFHFVFGMAEDFGGKPFSLVHYLSVKSAIEINKPQAAYFHYQFEPQGEWWQQAKGLLTLNKITAPGSFMGRPLYHVAHKADVIRLQVLKETGGVYLDLDTICVKPLKGLLGHSFVIGQELKGESRPKNWRQRIKYKLGLKKKNTDAATGLCNAVLLSEKDSEFVNYWLDEYKTFRSKGRDKYWNEHSVLVPQRIAAKHPGTITQTGPYSFHYPLYDNTGLNAMFKETKQFPEAYLHHLWESFSWDDYLSRLSVEGIRTNDTTYNLIARKFL